MGLGLWLAGQALLCPLAAAEPAADRVFFIVFDGLRDEEGVLAEDTYLPHLWNEFKPQGAYIFPLLNRDVTVTDGIHRDITTGRRQPVPGLPWYPTRKLTRALTPTLFEVVGRATGADPAGYIIGNTVFMDAQGRSLYPGTWPQVDETTTEANSSWSDQEITDKLVADIDDQHRVFLLNLHDADKVAHARRWDEYLADILLMDEITAELVQTVGTDRDAFFVFADHGRHSYDYSGHGDDCDGCRTSFLIAWGAGIKEDVTLGAGYELLDLAPTAAWLLGVDMPTARGHIISDILDDPPAAPPDEEALVSPSLALDQQGITHQVAQRLRAAGSDGWLVYRQRATSGQWSDWQPFAEADDTPEAPFIVSNGQQLWRLWRAWRTDDLRWGVYGQYSGDGGTTWGETAQVGRATPSWGQPQLAADGTGFVGLWTSNAEHRGDSETDLFLYQGTGTLTETEMSAEDLIRVPTEAVTVVGAGEPLTAFAAIPTEDMDPNLTDDEDNPGNQNRDIYLVRGHHDGALQIQRLTDDDELDYWPSLVRTSDGTLLLAWAHLAGTTLDAGDWSVRVALSTDDGETWSSPNEAPSQGEIWRPLLVDSAVGPWLLAVEIEGSQHRLVRFKLRNSTPTAREVVAESAGYIEEVSAVALSEGLLVSWQDSTASVVHHIDDALLDWTVTDTGSPSDSADTGEISNRRCLCGSTSGASWGAWLALLATAWRRRRRPVTLTA